MVAVSYKTGCKRQKRQVCDKQKSVCFLLVIICSFIQDFVGVTAATLAWEGENSVDTFMRILRYKKKNPYIFATRCHCPWMFSTCKNILNYNIRVCDGYSQLIICLPGAPRYWFLLHWSRTQTLWPHNPVPSPPPPLMTPPFSNANLPTPPWSKTLRAPLPTPLLSLIH